jgi:TetR/AcrR family transcriptional regulator, regulator of cefoperazone and chloramphenicol sensitivity
MTDATQERLLEAAEQVFAEKGFKAASIREICSLAGANVAAINYYFGDKERLYVEAVKYAHRGCTQGEPFPDWPDGTPAVDKLRDFIRVMVTRMLQPQSPASLSLMMREMAQPTAACIELVQDYIQPIADKLGGILAELLPETPVRQHFLVAFSIVGQCLFYRHHRPVATLIIGEEEFAKLDVELVAKHITAFTLHALGLQEKNTDLPVSPAASATEVQP